ncbi:MAG: agmatinase [Alphaproteobacteria bacterium]|nr:agmatinase [Alphaproteobacteria bacterium]
MATTPTYALGPGFMGIARSERSAASCVAGLPIDLGTTNRAGAREGPAAIRAASRMLRDGVHPGSWRDPLGLDLADIGNLETVLGDIPASFARIEAQVADLAHVVALGGDHGATLPLLRALRRRLGRPLALVQFDAHVDTWPDSFGQPMGHGSVFFRAIEEELVDPRRMVQVGIRSPVDRATWDWTLARGVTVLDAQRVHESGPAATAAEILRVAGGAPAYLSFDIDALDPAFAPGTGTPEIGGLATWQAQAILRALGGVDFVGMDVMEVAPAYDHAEVTALAAATIAWEYLSLMADPRRPERCAPSRATAT